MANKIKHNDAEYLQKLRILVITGLFSDDHLMEKLVLKGGNLLDLVYRISARTSVDVDLSIDGDFDESVEELTIRLSKCLKKSFADEELFVFDLKVTEAPAHLTENMEDFWGGYKIEFKIIEKEKYLKIGESNLQKLRRNSISVGKRGSTKFSIDMSKHEFCEEKESAELNNYRIFTYSPQVFVCEKIRAICQQMDEYARIVMSHKSARARDFVDVYLVVKHYTINFNDSNFRSLLRKVFNAKKVPMHLIDAIQNQREFHRGDFSAVVETIKMGQEIQGYDDYFDFVCECCE